LGFTSTTRTALRRLLGVRIVNVEEVVGVLEAQTNTYRLVRPSTERLRPELKALQKAAGEMARRLAALGNDATDLLIDALSQHGYDVPRLREGLGVLDQAINQTDSNIPPAQSGRPPDLTRSWFLREVCQTLVLNGQMDVFSRAGARTLSQCLRLLLEAAGEPIPADMRPLLNEARRRR
jgi:hypothetical protein